MRGKAREVCPRADLCNPVDSMAYVPCRDMHGNVIISCADAPDYQDYALPNSENLCNRSVAEYEPAISDPFKLPYIEACHAIDMVLSDDYSAGSTEALEESFEAINQKLETMIADRRLDQGDKGRYLYHIDARMLQAYLPAFLYRADHIDIDDMPDEIFDAIQVQVCGILEDFDESIYSNVATQVALRRTEVEILALLLRRRSAEFFPWPTLFREDASRTRAYNHDAYVLHDGVKIPIQVASTDYVTRRGRRKSDEYHDSVAIAIHQTVVNLDYRDEQTFVTKAIHKPRILDHDYDIYDESDPVEGYPRYVAWGARPKDRQEEAEFIGEYIQRISNGKRDGLSASILKESRGEQLSVDEMNLLNGATHYLMALVREHMA